MPRPDVTESASASPRSPLCSPGEKVDRVGAGRVLLVRGEHLLGGPEGPGDHGSGSSSHVRESPFPDGVPLGDPSARRSWVGAGSRPEACAASASLTAARAVSTAVRRVPIGAREHAQDVNSRRGKTRADGTKRSSGARRADHRAAWGGQRRRMLRRGSVAGADVAQHGDRHQGGEPHDPRGDVVARTCG
jgi:hypothetical protein